MLTKNIRGTNDNPIILKNKEKELHDCLDCKGCICEEYCAEQEEKYFDKKVKKAKKKGGENDG